MKNKTKMKKRMSAVVMALIMVVLCVAAAPPAEVSAADSCGISDYLGTWDGEYQGAQDGVPVYRHFVLMLDRYVEQADGTYEVSGTFTFSPSYDASQAAISSTRGSYKIKGVANPADATISSLRGSEWIDDPGDFTFSDFYGTVDASADKMAGYRDQDGHPFSCKRIEELSNSFSALMTLNEGTKCVNILKNSYNILKGSEEKCTIIIADPKAWNGEHYGKVALKQGSTELVTSESGTFVDITPGTLFEAGTKIYAVVYDKSGKVYRTKALKLTVKDKNSEKITVGQVKKLKLKNKKIRRIYISFKKIKGVSGYKLRFSVKKNMKKSTVYDIVKNKGEIGIYRNGKFLRYRKYVKGKTYYFQVRAYKLNSSGKRVYGKWSAKAKVKIKK